MNFKELEQKYLQIPKEIKETRRWVCYAAVTREDGSVTKIPMSPFGGTASTTDPNTWSTFKVSCLACEKYNYAGLGFILGKSPADNSCYFGIDLDNHADRVTGEKLSDKEFYELTNEFVSTLQSYSEYSHSGEGVHIICRGTLPPGNRRKAGGNVEMYDSGRFFTMTGKVINNVPIADRTAEIKPLWEKYLNTPSPVTETGYIHKNADGKMSFDGPYQEPKTVYLYHNLSDDEVLTKIRTSSKGAEFISLFNGDMSKYNNDHSSADLGLCTILAFWCSKNKAQMDRIFRSSALMRPKWDQKRGQSTYGEDTLDKAIAASRDTYTPPKEKIDFSSIGSKGNVEPTVSEEYSVNEFGDPNIKARKVFKHYRLTDTGNAERFYDQFGDLFKFNQDGNYWMYWNGKTWTVDKKSFIKKYADKLIDIMRLEAKDMEKQIEDATRNGNPTDELIETRKSMLKNIDRVSNKAGKEAMLSELQHLHDIPVESKEFDTNEYLLNTDSGVVDLRTGSIRDFDRKLMLSKNTNCKVSFEEPVVWNKFLHDVFERGNPEETEEIIECIQKCIGYSLSALTIVQCIFFLYGSGSNGKSTFIEQLNKILGEYGDAVDSELLIQNQSSSGQSNRFALSDLVGLRFLSTSETDEGKKLAEARIKKMTGSDTIKAEIKHGKSFGYKPTYKIWMSTNNKPIIRGTDYGIWRRIFLFPFERTFTEAQKDPEMPAKLAAETPKILGWAIKGYIKFQECLARDKGIRKPQCIEEALSNYRNEMDVINAWINSRCENFGGYQTRASELFEDYKNWAKDDNEYLMPNTKFGQELVKKGYKKIRKSDGWYYIGLKLNSNHKAVSFREGALFDDD